MTECNRHNNGTTCEAAGHVIGDAFDTATMDIKVQRDMNEDSIRSMAATLVSRINETVAALDNDHHVNSLGMLRQAALDFDRLCSEREQLISFAKRLDYLAKRV